MARKRIHPIRKMQQEIRTAAAYGRSEGDLDALALRHVRPLLREWSRDHVEVCADDRGCIGCRLLAKWREPRG